MRKTILMTKFIKFLFVGGSTAILQLSVFYFFLNFIDLDYRISVTVSFILALFYHFMANKIFTFKLSKQVKFTEVWKYAISSALSYFIILSCTIILVEKYKITPFSSNFFAILINIFITFSLLKLWVFNEKRN